jgi:soluble lytic murein transglycosylase-like protein
MRPLQQISVRAYGAKAARGALLRAVRSAISSRQTFRCTIAAALLVLTPEGLPWSEAEAGLTSAAVADLAAPIAAVPLPSMFVTTAAGGPAYEYVRRSAVISGATAFVPTATLTVEDAWSAAFFGDKQRLAAFIEHTATVNGLPVDFLLRLLRQESGLDYQAVSRAGAQGIAQFMPGTSGQRGLADPFNPYEAIPKSAELLSELRAQFGSLGLAAAAYNAGPQRVRTWLSGRSVLPKETREYVAKITDRSAEDWRQGGDIFASAIPRIDQLRY